MYIRQDGKTAGREMEDGRSRRDSYAKLNDRWKTISPFLSLYLYVYLYLSLSLYIYIYIYTHIMYIHIYVCMYVCMYTYI